MGAIKEQQIDAMSIELDKLEAVSRIKKILEEAEEIRDPDIMAWCRTAHVFLKDYSYGRKKSFSDVLTVIYRRGILEGEERILYRNCQFPARTEEDRDTLIRLWDDILNAYLEGVKDHVS